MTDQPYAIAIDGHVKFTCKIHPKQNRKAHDFKGLDAELRTEGSFNYIPAAQRTIPDLPWQLFQPHALRPRNGFTASWGKGQDGMLDSAAGQLAWSNQQKAIRVPTAIRSTINNQMAQFIRRKNFVT